MTSDAEMDPAVFARMFQVAFDPEIVRCMNAIRQLADYDIAQDRAASFLRFHSFITSPQPRYITDWRADPKCTISRNGPARFRVNGPTLHGLPAEPRFGSFTRPFSLRQVFWL